MNIPVIENYGKYSSDNYGAHTLRVRLDTITLYYSYNTVVAFKSWKSGLVVCENVWGPTTGKHLNWIDPYKNYRVPHSLFQKRLEEALAHERNYHNR